MILTKFFNQKQDIIPIGLLGILVFVFKAKQFSLAHNEPQIFGLGFAKLGVSVWILEFLAAILIVVQCFWANNLLNKIRFTQNRTQYFAFAYFVLIAQNPQWLAWGRWHIAALCGLWILQSWIAISQTNDAKAQVFGAGLKMGICFLFYPNALVLMPIGFLAMYFMGAFTLKNNLVFVISFLTPIYFFGAYSFLFNKMGAFAAFTQKIWVFGGGEAVAAGQVFEKQVLFGSILLMVSGVFLLNVVMQIKTGLVRSYSAFFTWCLFLLCGFSFFYANIFDSILFVLPYGVYFLACLFFAITPRWFLADAFLLVLVGFVGALQLYVY